MGEVTGIAWAHSTLNFWEGCTQVAPECDNCYAKARDQWLHGGAHWGPNAPRRRTAESTWKQAYRWNRRATESGEPWRVFVNSLSDWADNAVPPEWRDPMWQIIRECPDLTFLLLTKRIGNVPALLPKDWGSGYRNVWLGITTGTQAAYDRDYRKLAAIPAYVHWLSIEPQLERIKLRLSGRPTESAVLCPECDGSGSVPVEGGGKCCPVCYDFRDSLSGRFGGLLPAPDWVVTGGESGKKARPYDIAWPRALDSECRNAGVALFVKQLGAHPYDSAAKHITADLLFVKHHAGADPSEWAEDLRVREFPA